MSENWYKKWFSTKEYLELYKHRNSTDAAKIAGLIFRTLKLKKGSKILDVACGNGRHSLIFASKGYNVLGIDLSAFLISEAFKKLKTDYRKQNKFLKFEIRDMRSIQHKNEFDLAVNLFSSFGYFEKDSENFKVLKSISNSLKRGGYFFFDYLNKDNLVKNLVPFDIKKRNRNVIIQVREIKNNAVYKKIYIIKNNNSKNTPSINEFSEMIKLYSLAMLKKTMKEAGMKIIKTFGDYSGSRYNRISSERMIILAQKIK